MPETSRTTTKVQRARRAGGQRPTGGRPDGFVIALVGLVLVCVVLVALARRSKVDAGVLRPVANRDHWYEAFGIYDCDHYLPALPEVTDPPSGIGPLANGLISVAPSAAASAGANATFGTFAEDAGLSLTSTSFSADGTHHDASTGCTIDGHHRSARLVLYRWPPQANPRVTPTEVRGAEISDIRFAEDRAIYALAIVPESTQRIPLPPSVDAVAHPTDAGG